jgi:hypothetical protein
VTEEVVGFAILETFSSLGQSAVSVLDLCNETTSSESGKRYRYYVGFYGQVNSLFAFFHT